MKLRVPIIIFFLTISGLNVFGSGNSDPLVPPVISVGPGILFYKGDIGNKAKSESFFSHSGLQVELQLITNSRISVSAFYMSGKVSANNYDYTRPLNFQSSIFSQGLQARYDFISKRHPDATITPFIGAGVEILFFRSYTDLLDANGNKYHYWSDGTIRSDVEPSLNASTLYRDYVYETNIRDADIDGLGKYRQNCLSFPFTAGARMRISNRCAVHFFATYHMLRSDLIDGISISSIGNRKGDKQNDRLIFTGFTFRYDLASHREKIASAAKESESESIPNDNTEKVTSPEINLPNQSGVVNKKELTENTTDSTIKAADIIAPKNQEEVNLKPETKGVIQNNLPIPSQYKFADTNNDGFISPTEIGKATDDFMAGKSALKSDDFYKLIDFYFDQYK
jgi:hypothetical protein